MALALDGLQMVIRYLSGYYCLLQYIGFEASYDLWPEKTSLQSYDACFPSSCSDVFVAAYDQ